MTHITDDLANIEASIERQRRRIADGLPTMALNGVRACAWYRSGTWHAEASNEYGRTIAEHTGSSAMDALAQLVSAWNAREV